MSIDADLNQRIITEKDAQSKTKKIKYGNRVLRSDGWCWEVH